MSSFSRLWTRAPHWRSAIYYFLFFSVITVLFPIPWLRHHVPLLERTGSSVDHFFGGDAPPDPAAENAGGSGDQQSAAPQGNSPGGGQNAAASGGQQDGAKQTGVSTPIEAELHDALPFTGRTLPLPPGTWHPVVSTQDGPHGEVVTNVLIRTVRGVVTGVIVASANTQPLPISTVSDLDRPCHDDRNYESHIGPSEGASLTCWYTSYTVIGQGPVSEDSGINWAFERLHVLDFPMPPLMIATSWKHIEAAKTTGVNKGANFENVTILLSPTSPGTTKMLAPVEDWTKQGIAGSPLADRFVHDTIHWMEGWVPVLQRGFSGTLQPGSVPAATAADPAYHP